MSTSTITPYRLAVPDSALDDLRERLARTRWPDEQQGVGRSQGLPLSVTQDLAAAWVAFDWRARETQLNTLAQYRPRSTARTCISALRRLTRERTGQYMLWQRLPVLGWLWRHLPKVLPRSYEARLNDLRQQTDITLELGDNRELAAVMLLVIIIGLRLAAHGWYVLKFIAST